MQSKAIQFILTFFSFTILQLSAQSDLENLEKYWKFRYSFVEDFVKIGPGQGESLPIGARSPSSCIDNISEWGGEEYGTLHWGDGMIRQGHYLGFLATEYALKKRSQIDTKGVLNELYFALMAIDRLDARAESELAPIYGMDMYSDHQLNGFFLREDVPEDFQLNWQDDPGRYMCVNSAFYENNNVAKIHDPENGIRVKQRTSYQNVPSLDQLSSLMVGLRVVHKLVDEQKVQPDYRFEAIEIKKKVEEIVLRLVGFGASHNWFLIDVNGWPVGNGGGDLLMAASTLIAATEEILGSEVEVNTKAIRRMQRTLYVQQCLTGYGLSEGDEKRDEICNSIHFYDILEKKAMIGLEIGGEAGPLNNQDVSVFQNWVKHGWIRVNVNSLDWVWKKTLADRFANLYDDMHDDGKIESLPWPLNKIMFDKNAITHYNNTIIFNLGVLSGWWDSMQVHHWATITENRQLELINSVLTGKAPYMDGVFYRQYLDSMSIYGPYRLKGSNCCPSTEEVIKYQEGGWASEYKWTHPSESHGEGGMEGLFSGLDYMYFHNLYQLLFKQEEDFKVMLPNYQLKPIEVPLNHDLSNDLNQAIVHLNRKLARMKTQTPRVSANKGNAGWKNYEIGSIFPEYNKWGINTLRVIDEDLILPEGMTMDVNTDLIIEEGVQIIIGKGAELRLNGVQLLVSQGGLIEVNGSIRMNENSVMHLKGGSELYFRKSAKLYVDRHTKVNCDRRAYIQVASGAQLIERQSSVFTPLFLEIEKAD